jgi:MFS family permease
MKVRDYSYLWIGMLSSSFAMSMQTIAQGWLVYEMSGSALDLTWVTLAFMLPTIFFSLPGGVIADRLPKKPIIGLTPIINGVASLIMAMIIMFGHVTFWDFIWVGLVNGTVMALSMPARTAFIPEIVGEKLMFNAMAFVTATWNLSRILGPALAGFMIAIFADGNNSSAFGVGLVFFVLSFLYFVSSVTVLFIRHDGVPESRQKETALTDIKQCLSYVVNSPIVGGLMLLAMFPFMFGNSINILLPAFNTDVLAGGPDDLGLLMTGMGVGAILGSLTLAKLGNLRRKGLWLLFTEALWGLTLVGFALTTTFAQAVVAISAVGFVSAVNMSMNRSLVQLQVKQHMRGRVMSLDMMAHGVMPLGMLPIGYISEVVSVEAGLIASGATLFLCTIIMMVMIPKIRTINTGFVNNTSAT